MPRRALGSPSSGRMALPCRRPEPPRNDRCISRVRPRRTALLLRSLLAATVLWTAAVAPVAEAQSPALPDLSSLAPLPLPAPVSEAEQSARGEVATLAGAAPPLPAPVPGAPPVPAPPTVPVPPGVPAAPPLPFPWVSDPLGYAAALAAAPPDPTNLEALVAFAAAAGGQGGVVVPPTFRNGSLEEATLAVYDALGLVLTPEQLALLHDAAAGVDDALAEPVALLLFAIADTHAALARQLDNMTAAELRLLAECGLSPAPDPANLGAPACSDPVRAREAALKYLGGGKVLGFELGLLAALQDALAMLSEVAESYGVPLLPHAHSQSSQTVDNTNIFSDPLKLIEIGSLRSDVYRGNTVGSAFLDPDAKVLTIDLAGDDVYEARAGAAAPYLPVERSLEGDELDQHQQQGITFGSLVGVSIDLGGRDHYVGRVGSLGAGDLGVGLLVDLGGDDTYEASSGSQGAAYVGLGLLFDAAGNDTYISRYRSQGHGMLGGLGLLLDAAGDDRYTGELLTQGAGSIHGVGLLLDAAGADRYTATAAATTASQGASHLVGVGFLVDADGPDQYESADGARGYVYEKLEKPWNVGLGVFFDRGGADLYVGPSPGADDSEWSTLNGGRGWDTSPEHEKNASRRLPPPPSNAGGGDRGNSGSTPGNTTGNTTGNSTGDPSGNATDDRDPQGNASADGAGSGSASNSGGSDERATGNGHASGGSSSDAHAAGTAQSDTGYAGPATADARLAAPWRPPEDGRVGSHDPMGRSRLAASPAEPSAPPAPAQQDEMPVRAPDGPPDLKEVPLPQAIGALALLVAGRMLRRRGA